MRLRWLNRGLLFLRLCRYFGANQLTGTIPSTLRQLTMRQLTSWYDSFCSVSTASHSVCSNFASTCLVSGCLLWRCLFSPESTGLLHESLPVWLHQPSSCHLHSRQFADDCNNERADNSSDDHNDVDNCCDHDIDGSHGRHAADRWCRRWVAPVSCRRRARRLFGPPAQICSSHRSCISTI
jgi:hypothetical protein